MCGAEAERRRIVPTHALRPQGGKAPYGQRAKRTEGRGQAAKPTGEGTGEREDVARRRIEAAQRERAKWLASAPPWRTVCGRSQAPIGAIAKRRHTATATQKEASHEARASRGGEMRRCAAGRQKDGRASHGQKTGTRRALGLAAHNLMLC